MLVPFYLPIDTHHSDPKYLGGNAGQKLFDLPEDVHREIHKLIDEVFPRTAPKGIYAMLFQNPEFKEYVKETLVGIYSQYEGQYPGLLASFFKAFNQRP